MGELLQVSAGANDHLAGCCLLLSNHTSLMPTKVGEPESADSRLVWCLPR